MEVGCTIVRQRSERHDDFQSRQLEARARRIETKGADGLGLRVHRALSWLDAAERCGDDDDARFIFLRISLNAAYRMRSSGSRPRNRRYLIASCNGWSISTLTTSFTSCSVTATSVRVVGA